MWLGTHYQALKLFIERQGTSLNGIHASGLYMRALCNGIEETLDKYRSTVVEMETKILNDPLLSLTSLHQGLHLYAQILPAITGLTARIDRDQVYSCLQVVPVVTAVLNSALHLAYHVLGSRRGCTSSAAPSRNKWFSHC